MRHIVDPGQNRLFDLFAGLICSPAKRLIADTCLTRGWRYCPRLHIDLYGNRRGT